MGNQLEWLYNNIPFTENDIADNYGFVYIIENVLTKRKYIGKKLFWFSKTKQVNKKRKKYKVVSDWQEYYGSNEQLKKDIERLKSLEVQLEKREKMLR